MFHNSIGIQYNWREEESYPLKAKLQKALSHRIVVDDPYHVTVNFPDNQPPSGQNRQLLDRILTGCSAG